jgi:predicted nuclease of restriction endonuclease-like (RecB) superfamily
MAEQILKDPYNFDFLTVTATAKEREIERGLLMHLRDLLLELGRGFSFVGSLEMEVTPKKYTIAWRQRNACRIRIAGGSWTTLALLVH